MFLVKTIIDLYIMALLLRIWMQWVHCDFYNSFTQFIIKITQPIIWPLRQIIPSTEAIDSTSVLLALFLSIIKFPILTLIEINTITLEPVYLLIGLLVFLKSVGKLVFWIIIIRSLLSWMSQGHSPIDLVLYQLSEPLMSHIRRLLPSTGGIDFSSTIVTIIIYSMNYLGMDLFPDVWYRI